jgi:hypothetical protein
MSSQGVGAVVNGFINIDIAVSDFEIETAVRIGTDPGLVLNRGSLAAEIRKGNQVSSFALLALWEIIVQFQRSTSLPI